jgi:TolA-binding protein
MTRRLHPWKSFVCFAIFTAGLSYCSPGAPDTGGGIGQAADAAAAAALDLLNSGKLPDAENAYTALLLQFPTSGVAPEAMFRLGYVQYLQGETDAALITLKRIVSPPATPEIKAAADALIPQVMVAAAAKLNPDDQGRKAAFQNAIQQFDAFIQQYPKSPNLESAQYGRAAAAFQIQDYDGAAKGLRQNLQEFANSPASTDSEELLATVLTAEGNDILKSHGDQEAAYGKFNEALGYLANLIERNTDVAAANNSQFQIGEILFARANAETGGARANDLEHAMDAYRAVRAPEALLEAQQARVAAAVAQVRQAAVANNPGALAEMQRQQDRENAKLEAIKNAPDQTLRAQLRIASCYFLLQKYDETRVLLRYLQGFAQDDDAKKQIQYFTVLTYALQGITGKAEDAYKAFQSAYRGDAIGENLPLVMGVAFLTGSNSQPEKAAEYLRQEREFYPTSPLVNEALNEQANAYVRLRRYNDAIATYRQFLATHPPREQAADAGRGIAAIYQQTGKIADAVREYEQVADTYPGTAAAEQCAFYAAALETTVDQKQALPLLQAFVAKHPNGELTPRALLMTGQMQAAQGQTAAAIETYKELEAKFPKSEFTPQAYFQQAGVLGNEGKTDEMVALMRDFMTAYPNDKQIFYAYDTIGQSQIGKGDVTGAIGTYAEMVAEHPENPMAATALYRSAELWRKQAGALGLYPALSEAQRKDWNTDVAGSIAAAEKLLEQFPDSDQVGVVLKTLLADQQMLLDAQQKKPEEIDKYFNDLAEKFASNASERSRIMFTLATFTYGKNPVLGLAQMSAAYDPALVYAPDDLDVYGAALIAQGKADEAYKVYEKIARDYPVPQNARPIQARPAIQEAQAAALFGMGAALDKEGKTADAARMFAELKANYPWSPKVMEANFGIAKSLVAQQKLDDASKLLVGIVGSRTASASLRAHAFLLVGQIQEGKGNITAAIDSYLKTAAYYGGVADAAAEGLWRGGQMLEKQAADLTEQSTPKKSEQIGKAVSAYKDIGTKYPDSPFVQQAEDRLKALGAG